MTESGPSPTNASLIGTPIEVGALVVGKYRVDRILGQGGMGVVLAATHEQLDQRVALKFLLPDAAAVPEIAQRFIREARASVQIHSEHVARVLDVGTLEGGTPFMVMEYLEGEDLSQALARRGPLPVEETVGYVLQACEALAEAHSLGMVHRDLKPANLFLARRPSGKPAVKVLDFGISKLPTSERDKALTQSAAMLGSPSYMSPEQMMSSDKVTVQSDIWSLGVVLYELLSQELPFLGDTMPELVASILGKQPAPLRSARTDVPTELVAVIETCLQKEPTRRYTHVAAFAQALAPFGSLRARQSVERIEMVLGLRAPSLQPPSLAMDRTSHATGPQPTPTQGTAPDPAAPHPTAQGFSSSGGVESGVSPGTSRPRRRLLPFAIVVAVAAALGIVALTRSRAPVNPAASLASPLSSTPAAISVTANAIATASATASATAPLLSAMPSTLAPAPSPPDTSIPSAAAERAPEKASAPSTEGRSHPSRASGHANSTTKPAAASTAQAPGCHLVKSFDTDGNEHFRRECP